MRLNVVLLVVLLASVGANLAIRQDVTRPNREFLPEMVHSMAYESFSANPNFPDGKTLQVPVAGTIRRPDRIPANAISAQRGAVVFQTFCQPCHGAGGKGDGPVVQRGYPAPPSLLAEKAVSMSDGEMFRILSEGQKNMPSYASQLSREDRWSAIRHVRTLQPAVKMQAGQP